MQAAFWVTHQSPLKLELLELRTRSCSRVSTLTFSVYSSEVCIEYTGYALIHQSLPAALVKRTPGKQNVSRLCLMCSDPSSIIFHWEHWKPLSEGIPPRGGIAWLSSQVSNTSEWVTFLFCHHPPPQPVILLAKWRPNSTVWGFSQLHNALEWLANAWCW